MLISVEKAVELLNNGQVVAVPTETVYGLAGSLSKPQAIDKVFALKGRPAKNPLIIHIHDIEQLRQYAAEYPPDFDKLIEHFWPGPLTVVLKINESTISSKARAGLPTAAFRMPKSKMALNLIKKTGPLVMPSANLSGRPSSTKPEHVEQDFGTDFPVLDGGSSVLGLESTILIFTENRWTIIRQGAISREQLEKILGYRPAISDEKREDPLCPGQMFRHYAPKANIVLDHAIMNWKGVVVGFSNRKYLLATKVYSLGQSSDPSQAAENLYAVLRQLDLDGIANAHIDDDFPETGLWATIRERLLKASRK